jgi:hypothetical protein
MDSEVGVFGPLNHEKQLSGATRTGEYSFKS